ncbi:toxin-antitoxin system YwqK family antitoxin [Fusobacterium canifelinum]|uniref:Toxin-antitoxin system YwqK family antitoxin n=1 Tax=Fusobacterium canifelinum TaxID=285729 RepID=A0A7T9LFG2_9FUSO|nr:toxin-antitoxin system YwqK family antitoxin [Fusobacterium canifelinum]QQB74303.1 toxin-antitoxin system YwqK family antitoxin [Fusobacterium canifelinum]QQS87812.1 toxin-antitoxin system YwqK family antitoxin [Fusobacterium canifelinum]
MKIKKIFLFLLLFVGFELLAVSKLPKNLFNSDKINILKKGILNGPINVYYPNGKIQSKQFFINNRKAGIWQYFYENGKLKTEIVYNIMSNEEEGIVKNYDEKGVIISEGKIVNNNMAGVWNHYDEKGRKNYTYDFVKGIIIAYDEKGKVIFQVTEGDLARRFQEIQQEINDDRIRANEEKN